MDLQPQGNNNRHALKSGLRPVYRPVDIKDVISGEVWNFNSISEASDILNVNTGHIMVLIRDRPLYPHFGRFAFKYADAPFDWPTYDINAVRLQDKTYREKLLEKAVVVRDIKSTELIIYANMASAGKAIGFTLDDMKTAFRIGSDSFGQPKLWPYKGYEFRWLSKKGLRSLRKNKLTSTSQ